MNRDPQTRRATDGQQLVPELTASLNRALGALDGGVPVPDPVDVRALGSELGEGERALFGRALQLKRDLTDLNDRVLRSAQFAEASLGTAAFIHELRQCLTPIIGLAELMKESPQSPFVSEWVQEIAGQAGLVADLLDRHAALLRTGSTEAEAVDVFALCQEAARYFTRLPAGVRLVVEVPADLPKPLVRRRQLLHALINLVANARDAQKGRAGQITIQARELDGRLELLVTDQGKGIDPAVRDRLFEPLFTTKAEEGTGLGLYLSRELLRPTGELVLLSPEETPEGAKTAFAIRLPRPQADGARATLSTPAPGGVAAGVGGTRPHDPSASARRQAYERLAPLWAGEKNNPVLLVEDEPAVRRMTRAVLESVGTFKIYEAADAAFALGMLDKIPVDFLVCDKNLPDQDGLEVIRRARTRYPAIDAMIVTGYPSPESAVEAIRMGATDYLLKPVRELKTLRDSVSQALLRQRLTRTASQHEAVLRELSHALSLEGSRESELRRAAEELSAQLSKAVREAPPRVVVLGSKDHGLISGYGEAEQIEAPAELNALAGDVDLVVFSAEESSDTLRTLVGAGRSRASAPHLFAVGEFVTTEAAVAAIQGRTGFVLPRGGTTSAGELLTQATQRRRSEVRADALLRFVRALGISA